MMRVSLTIVQYLSVVTAFRENGELSGEISPGDHLASSASPLSAGESRVQRLGATMMREDGKAAVSWVETTTDGVDSLSKLRQDVLFAGGQVTVENISSYYNWEGSLHKAVPEYRLTGLSNNDTVLADILMNWRHDHTYEVPMLLMQGGPGSRLAVASVKSPTPEILAEALVSRRYVACAQVSGSNVQAKTTVPALEVLAGKYPDLNWKWHYAEANDRYVHWVITEVQLSRSPFSIPLVGVAVAFFICMIGWFSCGKGRLAERVQED
jgi:uncharacterized protein involved in tolerance to divalent cations